MRKLIAAAAVLLGMSYAASAATVVPIVNGSFEQTSITNVGAFSSISSGSNALTGWTVGGGGVDLIGTHWNASNGTRSLDLNLGSAGNIAQTVTGLIVGRSYQLAFDMSANPDGTPNQKRLAVSVGGVSDSFFFNRNGTSRPNMTWVTNTLSFTASVTSALLRFTSTTTGPGGSNSAFGPALDNVRLTLVPVPLPATAPLALAGLAALAFIARRRRTAA